MMSLESSVQAFARDGFAHQFGKPSVPVKDDPEWRKVRDTGTRLWLDTGDIDEAGKLWNSSLDALTTNNTLLNKEIQKGIYDDLVAKAARVVLDASPKISPQDLVLEIAFILNAHHALRLVNRFDANVSVELHTDLAGDVDRTVAYGKRYFAICPERFYVKVPLTPAGYLSARKLAAAGIPLNFTLGFSARHNYVAALLTKPDYVNVFLGRLNSVVADNKLGDGRNVGEKATLATQRALLDLRNAGRTKTRLIAASIRSGEQIGALAGVDVHTMPTKAAAEYRAKPLPNPTSQVANRSRRAVGPRCHARTIRWRNTLDRPAQVQGRRRRPASQKPRRPQTRRSPSSLRESRLSRFPAALVSRRYPDRDQRWENSCLRHLERPPHRRESRARRADESQRALLLRHRPESPR